VSDLRAVRADRVDISSCPDRSRRTAVEGVITQLGVKVGLAAQLVNGEGVIARDALVQVDGFGTAGALEGAILLYAAHAVPEEAISGDERRRGEDVVQEVVEGAEEDAGRSDVGGDDGLTGGALEGLDCLVCVDASGYGVLRSVQ
jgi:hypothetical protein